MLSPELSLPDFARSQLRPGEIVRWAGRPDVLNFTFQRSWRPVGIGLVWCAIVFAGVPMSDFTDTIGLLFRTAFAAVGLWFVLAPLREYWRATSTVYVVTTERAIIFNGLLRATTKSVFPGKMGPVEIALSKNGAGSVSFFTEMVGDGEGGKKPVSVGFIAIADPKGAEKALLAIQSAHLEKALRALRGPT